MKVINRVKKYQEFKEILKKRSVKNDIFNVYFRNNEFGYARVGILVSKKNGIAVTRVKIKRQVRTVIDEILDYPNVSKDFIVVVRPTYKTDEFQENRIKLIKLFNSIKEM